MRSYVGFLLRRFKWAKSGFFGHVGNVALVVGFILAILAWSLPDWTRQHVSERMNAFVLGIIPLLAGASVFLFRWFFLSSFFLHKTEGQRIKELKSRVCELEQTGLRGRIVSTAMFRDDKQRTGIAVTLQITNTGEPSTAGGWGLTFKCDGVNHGFPAVHTDFTIPDKSGRLVRVTKSDMLYEKIAATPLPKGGSVTGLIVFLTKDMSYDGLVAERPPVTVVFHDVYGRECTAAQQGQGLARPFHEPGYDDPFAPILTRQAKEAKEGQKLYYSVVEKINQGRRPIMALIELGIADELDTNEDVVNFCRQLAVDGHGDPFEHLKVMYPPEVRQEFLKDARRKNLRFPNEMSEVEFMNGRLREHLSRARDRMEEQKAKD